MTRHSEKARALFLATLMVISVFGMTMTFAGTVAASGHNVSSSGDVGLASDIPGPIEYRGSSDYQVVVALDRHLNDTSNIDVKVTGTNPDGGTVDTGNLTVSAGSVTTSDGVAGDGSALNNSVLRIDVGTSTDESNNIVTDGNLQVWNNTASSLISEFDVIGTSAQIDAGNPENNSIVYGGERVAVYNLTGQHDKYEVFNGGNFQFSGQSGQNTTVAYEDTDPETSNFETEQTYRFDFIDRDMSNRVVNGSTEVEIRDLGLDVNIGGQAGQTDTYPEDDDSGLSLTGEVSSNVANRNVDLDLNGEDKSQSISLRGGGADRVADFEFTLGPGGSAVDYSVTAEDLDTGITAESGVYSLEPVEGNPEFSSDLYTVDRGNNGTFTVLMNGLRSTNVSLGDIGDQADEDANYGAKMQVTDTDGDGQVQVEVDTYYEGARHGTMPGTTYVRALDGDGITIFDTEYQENDTQLDTGTYSLGVAGSGGDAADVATFQVTSSSATGMNSWVAPSGAANDSMSILDSATRGSSSALGDNFIIQVNTTGPFSLLTTSNLSAGDITLSIDQSNADEMNTNPNTIPVRDAGTLVDEANDRVYHIIDTDTAPGVAAGQEYEVTYDVDGSNAINGESLSLTTSFTIEDREFRWGATTNQTGDINVDAELTTLSGRTTAAPGTTFRLRVQSDRDDVPFLFTEPSVEVQDDGTFGAEFDFTEAESGLSDGNVPFTVSLSENSAPASGAASGPSPVDGYVLQPPNADLTFSQSVVAGDQVIVVEEATLSRGGFLVIHESDDGAPGAVIGHSEKLSAGTHEDVRLALDSPISSSQTLIAMAHRDTNDNNLYEFPGEDGPYTNADGAPVTDSSDIEFDRNTPQIITETVVQPSPTPEVITETVTVVQDSPTPEEVEVVVTETVVQTEVVTETVIQEEEVTVTITQTPDSPGMGLVVAVIALLAAAMLAVRRRSQ